MRRVVMVLVAASLAGCAAPGRQVMVYFPETATSDVVADTLAWPAAQATPRLEYAGQLVGEDNFIVESPEAGGGRRFLEWLVGLGRGREQKQQLVRPQSGVVDSLGRILVTDVGRQAIFVFDETAGTFALWRDAAPGVEFRSPVGIVVLADGRYLVADADLGEVFVLDAAGKPAGTFGAATLERPTGVAYEPVSGEVFIADPRAHRVSVFSTDGGLLRSIGVAGDGEGELNAPMHLGVGNGRLYVSDALKGEVLIYDAATGDYLGQIGRRGLFVGNFVRPKGVALDREHNVYVVEGYYDHLLVYSEEGDFLLPLGGTGDAPGQFFLPAGAWSDGQDRIFVCDMFNARVVIFRYVGAPT